MLTRSSRSNASDSHLYCPFMSHMPSEAALYTHPITSVLSFSPLSTPNLCEEVLPLHRGQHMALFKLEDEGLERGLRGCQGHFEAFLDVSRGKSPCEDTFAASSFAFGEPKAFPAVAFSKICFSIGIFRMNNIDRCPNLGQTASPKLL